MEEMQTIIILKFIFRAIGIIGVAVGLDFIFGAKVSLALKHIFDKAFDIDRLLFKAITRRILGATILIVSLAILFSLAKTKL